MTTIFDGRFTAHTDEPFVVFLIGMRINRFRALRKWLTVSRAMAPMIAELQAQPAKGLLGMHAWAGWRQGLIVQYWRSFEHLERFARDPDATHHPQWRRFNQLIGSDGTAGIWHETYQVQPGSFETFYGNMPLFGLAAATEHVPATGRRETARQRLGSPNGHTRTPIAA